MQAPKNFVPRPFAYHEELDLRIESLSNAGVGLARSGEWVVMVPFVIPGERVRGRVFRNFKNYSEADLVEVLEPSPSRVDPVCPLFGTCGGCQYQHIAAERQLEEKTRQVAEAMRRIGGIEQTVEPMVDSPRRVGYRSKLTPHYDRPDAEGNQPIGFRRHGRRSVVDMEQCPIATEAINDALPEARARARREGGAKRRKRGGTLLLRDTLDGVATDPKSVVSERAGELLFQFRAGEFFQNNPFVLPLLVDHVRREAQAPGIERLLDAYCGVGVFALSCAGAFDAVGGIEISEEAVRWARANAEINGIAGARFRVGRAEAIFASTDSPADATCVVIDPPRKGCDADFRAQLLGYGPARIVYVSCDPATQARDVGEFAAAGYAVERIQPFDMFPQTKHVESVVTLRLA